MDNLETHTEGIYSQVELIKRKRINKAGNKEFINAK